MYVFESRRNLQDHEEYGGHTIERHVRKSDAWLRNRLTTDPNIPAASTFRNESIANRTNGQFVKQNKDAINEWLKGGGYDFKGTVTMPAPIGSVIERGETNSTESHTAEVIILRDNSNQGWHIRTSYPIPDQ